MRNVFKLIKTNKKIFFLWMAPKPNEHDRLKQELTVLLQEYERLGLPIPPPEFETQKTQRTRGAGNAQNKKQERRKAELSFLRTRVAQLRAALNDQKE